MPYHDSWSTPLPAYTARCPNYPCRDRSCPDEYCQMYQWERDHIHPVHRRPAPPPYYTPSEVHAALKQHRDGVHRAQHLAHEIIERERRAEKEKLAAEARQKVDDIERGRAEREKDAEKGKKTRERQLAEAETATKAAEAKKKGKGKGRRSAGSDSETDSEEEDERLGRSFVRYLRRENERDRSERYRGRYGKYLERRWDGRGRPQVSLVSRQRVPSWASCFSD